MVATYFDGKYIAFFDDTTNGFYLDFESEELRLINITLPNGLRFDNLYNDGQDLYILGNDDYLYKWDDNTASPLTYTWKSKVFQDLPAVNYSVGRVINDASGTLTFKLYVDGVLLHTESTITTDELFRLPATNRNREFELEVTGTSQVDLIQIATAVEEVM
jgi:hypothetical protein